MVTFKHAFGIQPKDLPSAVWRRSAIVVLCRGVIESGEGAQLYLSFQILDTFGYKWDEGGFQHGWEGVIYCKYNYLI